MRLVIAMSQHQNLKLLVINEVFNHFNILRIDIIAVNKIEIIFMVYFEVI